MLEPMDRHLLEVEKLVWDGDAVRLGQFRCPVRHLLFPDSGPILNHVFVFPRTAVALQHEGEREFISGPNLVTLYNRGAVYRRRPITADGDACDWIQMRTDLLTETLMQADPEVADRPSAPLRASAPAPPRSRGAGGGE